MPRAALQVDNRITVRPGCARFSAWQGGRITMAEHSGAETPGGGAAGAGAGAGAGSGGPATTSRPVALYDVEWPAELQARVEEVVGSLGFELVKDWGVITREGDAAQALRSRVQVLLVHKHPSVGAAQCKALPSLKVVANFGVGTDHINAAECDAAGVPVGNTPGVLSATTADMAMALLLAKARNLVAGHLHALAAETTSFNPNWLGTQVSGAKLGIVGMGSIGTCIARRARAFDMPIMYHNRKPVSDEVSASLGGATFCEKLDDLLRAADFVMLACPCNSSTEGIIGAAQLAAMKPSAMLINIGRGKLVDQDALASALHSGTIAGCATDVTEPEPLPRGHKLLSAPNLIITPHLGSATLHTRMKMINLMLENAVAGATGKPLAARVKP